MDRLSYIRDYVKKYEAEVNSYEKKLTERANKVSEQIELIQKEFNRLNIDPFCYSWEEYDEEYVLTLSLYWQKSKVLFCFENREPVVLLGANRQVRISVENHIDSFLKQGLDLLKEKNNSIN